MSHLSENNPFADDPTLSPVQQAELQRVMEARHHDPFSVLGRHVQGDSAYVCIFKPRVEQLTIGSQRLPMRRLDNSDVFIWQGEAEKVPEHYQLHWISDGQEISEYDPYCFAPQLPDFDIHLFSEGKHWHIQHFLGAHLHQIGNVKGTLFATWAPNAERVSVIGEFNHWDGRIHPMRVRGGGIWELFIPGIEANALYKFEIRNRDSGEILSKTDPYARQYELRPNTAAVVTAKSEYPWQDNEWMAQRRQYDWQHRPTSIYEVHLGSWQQNAEGGFLNYRELAQSLVTYVLELGFTHIELMPITEHPLDASWGYQTTGYFAPTRRFGTADDFRYFVDHCHQHGIGVLLDWVPAHFPKDAHGLARFDGSPLYEHEDPRRGEHRDWGTLIYNFGRNEVKNFLLASALFWLEEFHLDGLRVDAVASMLYLDYSRDDNDWIPNIHGGNENLEAIAFLRELNTLTHNQQPGTVIIAEESTAWPQVTRPVDMGGLGFSMKWNMGWMHDVLKYMAEDPVHRQYHHNQLTFGLLYAFTENFVLPFSHDEVVHGKSSMLNKMPGDEWQRFANLRLLYSYMFTYPGKKLLFMGCEFGQGKEWDHETELDWYVLNYPLHQGMTHLLTDLNKLYKNESALHRLDFEHQGFEWLDCEDQRHSILAYVRKDEHQQVLVILNFTPVPRKKYRIGVPLPGAYREIINSDSEYYAGSNIGNAGLVQAEVEPCMGRNYSLTLNLPPLAALVLKLEEK
ncbi:1,4-alpha-glucan (glycogen) branching enzyme, GH-13-type [hydrothermal vent metagenome]|uniref:1,4-alpha-glucan branching enzyme n=1 Tax=hydrothermal vent metagenome TaxID=652676 RepID=A0A3B1BEP8_9ZZZZ